MPRGARRALTAALLLPLVLVSLSPSTYAAMVCASMGLVRQSCCCPAAGDARPAAPEDATAGAATCCSMRQVEVERVPSQAARAAVDAGLLPQWALQPTGVQPVVHLPAPRPVRAWHAKPPDGGRTVLLVKRSLLI